MLVKELKRENNLPEKFLDTLPETCEGLIGSSGKVIVPCKSPIGITESLGSLYCINSKCPKTLFKKIIGFSSLLELGSLTVDVVKDIIAKWGITNVLQLFMYEPSDGNISDILSYGESVEVYKIIQENKRLSLSQYIVLSQIEELNTQGALKLFSKFKTLDEIYKGIDIDSINFILNNTRENTSEDTKEDIEYATKVYESMKKGDFTQIQEFAIKIGNNNILELGKKMQEGGIDYVLSELNPTKDIVDIESLKIFKALIENKEELQEYTEYIELI